MFEDEGPDAFLGEQKAQDRSSASGTDYNDVNLYVHTRQDKRSETNGSETKYRTNGLFKYFLKVLVGFFPRGGVRIFQPIFQESFLLRGEHLFDLVGTALQGL